MAIASSTPMFESGDKIEVLKRRGNAGSLWFPAVALVSSLPNNLRHVMLVEFETLRAYLDNEKPLRKYVGVSCVRPAPPEELHKSFKVGDVVEAFCGERKGWRKAIVLDILENSKYVVCDDTNGGSQRHVEEVEQEGLRVCRVWNEGSWVPPIQLQKLSSKGAVTSRVKYNRIESGPKFAKGIAVEIKGREGLFQGSWYPATIVELLGKDCFLVEYQTVRTKDETEFLKEEADVARIRPCPPETKRVEPFKPFAQVDGWYMDGWLKGHISRVIDGLNYMVFFSSMNKDIVFKHCNLRSHQEWVEGHWVAAFKKTSTETEVKIDELELQKKRPHQEWIDGKQTTASKRLRKESLLTRGMQKNSKSKLGKLNRRNRQTAFGSCFTLGAKVEVTSNEEGYKGSWYTGLIVGDLGNGKYVVLYDTLMTDDETEPLKEEVDALDMRPSPPVVQQTENFRPLQEVDAWYNDGWWAGNVYRVLEGPKYSVYFKTTSEILEFQHSDLRPHQDWIDQEWIPTIRGRNSMTM